MVWGSGVNSPGSLLLKRRDGRDSAVALVMNTESVVFE